MSLAGLLAQGNGLWLNNRESADISKMMPSAASVGNYGSGPQNVKAGDGSQYNNNDKGTQFVKCTFHGSMSNSPQDAIFGS